jgi:hypothetical protein
MRNKSKAAQETGQPFFIRSVNMRSGSEEVFYLTGSVCIEVTIP